MRGEDHEKQCQINQRIGQSPSPGSTRRSKELGHCPQSKKNKKMPGKMEFRWAGALKDLRDKYTSVELQHKILEWRIGEK